MGKQKYVYDEKNNRFIPEEKDTDNEKKSGCGSKILLLVLILVVVGMARGINNDKLPTEQSAVEGTSQPAVMESAKPEEAPKPTTAPTAEPTAVPTATPTTAPTNTPEPTDTPEPAATPILFKTFDPSPLESMSGYHYDKFDKTWSYSGIYTQRFSDALIEVGISVYPEEDQSIRLTLLSSIKAPGTGKEAGEVIGVDFAIGDKIYSFKRLARIKDMGMSATCLTHDAKPLIEALSDAQEVDVRITYDLTKQVSFTLDKPQFITTLRRVCRSILELDMFECVNENEDSTTMVYATKWPMTIE